MYKHEKEGMLKDKKESWLIFCHSTDGLPDIHLTTSKIIQYYNTPGGKTCNSSLKLLFVHFIPSKLNEYCRRSMQFPFLYKAI